MTPLAIDPSLAGVITGVAAMLTAAGTLLLNVRGRQEQARQQEVVNAAEQDKQQLSQTAQALDATVKRAELAEAGEARKQVTIDEQWQRIQGLETALDEQRQLYRHMYAAQESRCREVTGELVDTLIAMRGVVRDEVTRAAVETAVEEFRPHPHELPPAEPRGDLPT